MEPQQVQHSDFGDTGANAVLLLGHVGTSHHRQTSVGTTVEDDLTLGGNVVLVQVLGPGENVFEGVVLWRKSAQSDV